MNHLAYALFFYHHTTGPVIDTAPCPVGSTRATDGVRKRHSARRMPVISPSRAIIPGAQIDGRSAELNYRHRGMQGARAVCRTLPFVSFARNIVLVIAVYTHVEFMTRVNAKWLVDSPDIFFFKAACRLASHGFLNYYFHLSRKDT